MADFSILLAYPMLILLNIRKKERQVFYKEPTILLAKTSRWRSQWREGRNHYCNIENCSSSSKQFQPKRSYESLKTALSAHECQCASSFIQPMILNFVGFIFFVKIKLTIVGRDGEKGSNSANHIFFFVTSLFTLMLV